MMLYYSTIALFLISPDKRVFYPNYNRFPTKRIGTTSNLASHPSLPPLFSVGEFLGVE
jgi:hypothetical protein